jgi:transcriptional regulator with GAF, ATPase, and Fis domain
MNEHTKVRARAAAQYAIGTGRLQPQRCSCGATKVDAHHDDYQRPLDVTWLCRACHLSLHAALRGREVSVVRRAIEEAGSVAAAARALGVSRRTVHRWMNVLHITVRRTYVLVEEAA